MKWVQEEEGVDGRRYRWEEMQIGEVQVGGGACGRLFR